MAKKELSTNQLAWVVLIAVVLVSAALVISGNDIIGKIIYGYTGSAECKDYDVNDRFPDGKNFGEASSATKGESAFFDRCSLSGNVIEYYCENGVVKSVEQTCPCDEGRCI